MLSVLRDINPRTICHNQTETKCGGTNIKKYLLINCSYIKRWKDDKVVIAISFVITSNMTELMWIYCWYTTQPGWGHTMFVVWRLCYTFAKCVVVHQVFWVWNHNFHSGLKLAEFVLFCWWFSRIEARCFFLGLRLTRSCSRYTIWCSQHMLGCELSFSLGGTRTIH